MSDLHSTPKGIVVFSGGSAANNLVDVFNRLSEARKCPLSYVIPISDNGGSSSELIRVFGGPGIGDVRSRLVRLIPDNGNDRERTAIKSFFNHRLALDSVQARNEWQDIVEARHTLWNNISSAKKELIRSFLNLLNLEIVKRARPSSFFNFSSASIGNMFLTGARLFSGSFESAIYLLSSICTIPSSISVLPAINTNFSLHISAGLANGTVITGQNAISHPSEPTSVPETLFQDAHGTETPTTETLSHETASAATNGSAASLQADLIKRKLSLDDPDKIEDANLPGSLLTLRKPYIAFTKSTSATESPIPARIARIWYINPYGQEIRPPANPKVVSALAAAHTLVYSIGSLYTSIVPSLVLRGVGAAIAHADAVKVLILNGSLDRETGPPSDPLSAVDFVAAIARACEQSCSGRVETVDSVSASAPAGADAVVEVGPAEWRKYVTHILYLDGPGVPKVDRAALAAAGIEAVRLYGRREGAGEDGGSSGGSSKGMLYDEAALTQALMALVGRRDVRLDRSRRNTLEA